MLFASCEQYNSESNIAEQSFNYESFNSFKNSNHLDNIIRKISASNKNYADVSVLEMNKQILSSVNIELGTDISIPESALSMSLGMDADEVYKTALKNDWLNAQDVKLAKEFIDDVKKNGLDLAIENYESKVLDLNLSNEEFDKKNVFINTIKSIDYKNPKLFAINTNSHSKAVSWWRCALATTAIAAATAGLAGCLTVAACAIAILLHVNASIAFGEQCFPD